MLGKPTRDELRRLHEEWEAKRREAEEIFAQVGTRIEARRLAEEARRERRRRIVRLLTFGRAA